MVKVPPLGLLTTVLLCAVLVSATLARPLPPPLPQLPLRRPAAARHPGPASSHEALPPHASAAAAATAHLHHHAAAARGGTPPPPPPSSPHASALGVDDFEDDGSARSERSTNLSALYGPGLPRRMFINDRHLQILPDGTVNGTHDQSDHTILHRLSVNKTQVKIQGLATCLFLCMDSCGLLYGSSEATEECVFTEKIDKETSYNTYSSVRYSNAKRTLYVALNKNGRPRKLQLRAGASFGKLMRQAKVLPLKVEEWHVKQLLARRHGDSLFYDERMVRHPSAHLCPHGGASAGPRREQDEAGRDTARCRGRKKRGKKKRRCRKGEPESELCQRRPGAARDPDAPASPAATTPAGGPGGPRRPKKCLEGEATAACKKRLRLERRRRKARLGAEDGAAGAAGPAPGSDAPAQRNKPGAKRPKQSKGKGAAAQAGAVGSAKRKGGKEGKDKQQQNQRGLARRVTSDVKQGKNGGESVTMTAASSGATTRARELTTRAASPSPPTTTARTTTTTTTAAAVTATPSTPTSVATPSSAAAVATTKVERSVPTLAASLGETTPSRPPPAAPTETTEPAPAPEPAPRAGASAEASEAGAGAGAAARSPTAPEGASLVAEAAAAPEPAPVAANRLLDGGGWEASGSAPPAGADY